MRVFLRLRREKPAAKREGGDTPIRVAIIAIAGIAIVIATKQSRLERSEQGAAARPAVVVDPFAAELAQCRDARPEQTVAFDMCRRVWSDNRQLFLASPVTSSLISPGNSAAVLPDTGDGEVR